MVRVIQVIPLERNRLHLLFSDGSSGICDISDLLQGPAFKPLSDDSFFNHVAIDENGGNFWPNGADSVWFPLGILPSEQAASVRPIMCFSKGIVFPS